MKLRALNLTQLFAAVLLSGAALIQSCSKKGVDPGPGGNPGPGETETLKFVPDSIFRVYLKNNVCPNAFDASGKFIDITHNEVKNFAGTMTIDTITTASPYVHSLKGIEYFAKMTKLVVSKSPIDSLNLPKTMAIDTLRLIINRDLQYVDVSGCTNMRYIRVSDIPAVSLDLSNLPALEYVNLISLKRLTDLNTTNSVNLRHLMTAAMSALKSVDVSTNTELRRLYFEYGYAINKIDITHNRKLYGLISSFSTTLKSVDFSKNDSLKYVLLDDSNIDSVDFSHNPKLISVAMLRTPLRNLDMRANPLLKLLYLDGCYSLQNVDLRAQTSFDYYSINWGKYGQMGPDNANEYFLDGYISLVPTEQHTIHAQAQRKGVNGATQDLFGGLRLPIFQDMGALSLTNVYMNEATKDNYSLVMSRRVLAGAPMLKERVYAQDGTTVVCADYDPLAFKCN